jgi:hypothetical protein
LLYNREIMGVIIEPENFENDNTQAKSEEEYYQSLVKTYQRLLNNYWSTIDVPPHTENPK